MGNELNIRQSTHKDYNRIIELASDLTLISDRGRQDKWIKEIHARKDQIVFVADQENKVIGWIHAVLAIRVQTAPFVEIVGLVVDRENRNFGIGKKLVERIITWAKEHGQVKIRVRSNVLREEALDFYSNIGFRKIKDQGVLDFIFSNELE